MMGLDADVDNVCFGTEKERERERETERESERVEGRKEGRQPRRCGSHLESVANLICIYFPAADGFIHL